MAFSYDDTLSTDRDKVRFTCGDTVKKPHSLTDAEVAALLVLYPDVDDCSLEAVDRILGRLATSIDQSGGGKQTRFSQRFAQYKDLRDKIAEKLGKRGEFTVYEGGISDAVATTIESNTDFRKHAFGIGEHDLITPPGAVTDDENC